MYCPRCGLQQISEQTKFCSRCGFQLGIVSQLLNHGGFLPELAAIYRKRKFFTKKNGVMFSFFWFMFFVFLAAPFWGIMDVDELAGVSAVIGIFGAIMFLIASLVFLPKSTRPLELPVGNIPMPDSYPAGLYGVPTGHTLPPQQTQPASVYTAPAGEWRAPDTGELVRPSVTEDTTKLLKKE